MWLLHGCATPAPADENINICRTNHQRCSGSRSAENDLTKDSFPCETANLKLLSPESKRKLFKDRILILDFPRKILPALILNGGGRKVLRLNRQEKGSTIVLLQFRKSLQSLPQNCFRPTIEKYIRAFCSMCQPIQPIFSALDSTFVSVIIEVSKRRTASCCEFVSKRDVKSTTRPCCSENTFPLGGYRIWNEFTSAEDQHCTTRQ